MANKQKNFNLDDRDIRYVQKFAEQNGNCSDSAALRLIIREHKQLSTIKPDLTRVALTPAGQSACGD